MPIHLLFPLFSSFVFVIAMLIAKQAIDRGARPWTGTFLANIWLAVLFSLIAFLRGKLVPWEAWPGASLTGVCFVFGQLFTFLAFRFGDVSVATPVFGVKILIVAVLSAFAAELQIPVPVWIAALLATAGIILVQVTGSTGRADRRRQALSVLLAFLAALSLSLFDVTLQSWAAAWDKLAYLTAVFVSCAVVSLIFVPWIDRPASLIRLGVHWKLLVATLLMSIQATSMSYVLSTYGDATRVNVVYALRGLWGVILAWGLAKFFANSESKLSARTMQLRLAGASLLTFAVIIAVVS